MVQGNALRGSLPIEVGGSQFLSAMEAVVHDLKALHLAKTGSHARLVEMPLQLLWGLGVEEEWMGAGNEVF